MQDEARGCGVRFRRLDGSSRELSGISIGSFGLALRHRHFGNGGIGSVRFDRC
jgi:hypothetical protein